MKASIGLWPLVVAIALAGCPVEPGVTTGASPLPGASASPGTSFGPPGTSSPRPTAAPAMGIVDDRAHYTVTTVSKINQLALGPGDYSTDFDDQGMLIDSDPIPHVDFSAKKMAVDANNILYVGGGYVTHYLWKFDPANLTCVKFAGGAGLATADGPLDQGSLSITIKHLATDPDGNVILDDGDLVRKIAPDGTISTLIGKSGSAEGAITTDHVAMQGMAIDAAGNLFFTQSQAQTTGSTYEPVSNQIATSEDTTASLVFKLAPDGKFTRVAGGKAGNKDGPVASAQFGAGGDIVVDSKGNLFFLDLDNGLLREITSDGRVVTLANTKSTLLRIDRSDNLYFLVDNYVWKQDPAGQIYKIAGTGKLGRTDGPGTTASFSQTQDLVVDGNGTIYVSEDWFDGKKFAIRVISRGG